MSTWFRDTEESRRMLAEERLVIAASELTSEALERRGRTRPGWPNAWGSGSPRSASVSAVGAT